MANHSPKPESSEFQAFDETLIRDDHISYVVFQQHLLAYSLALFIIYFQGRLRAAFHTALSSIGQESLHQIWFVFCLNLSSATIRDHLTLVYTFLQRGASSVEP